MKDMAVLFGQAAAERTARAVKIVEKMVVDKDARQSRRPVLQGNSVQNVYYCFPSNSISAATGTWPNLTPGSANSVPVYQAQAGALSFVSNSTVYNWHKTVFSASKVTQIMPDGTGAYDTVDQDC